MAPMLRKQSAESHQFFIGICTTVLCSFRVHITSPPFCPHMGLCKHGDPVLPHFWAFFGNHRFCGSNPKEKVVCRLQERIWVSKCWCSCNYMCSCVLGCVLAYWTLLCSH